MRDPREVLQEFAETCIGCNACSRTDCGNFPEGTPNLGILAQEMLDGDEEHFSFAFTCALCNRCTAYCPAHLRAADMSKPARILELERYTQLRPQYRKFRTDLKYNLFSMLYSRWLTDSESNRHIQLIEGEPDLGGEADSTAFFPGCSLFAYAPELTHKVFDWLREEELASRLCTFCCGATFYDVGFAKEFEDYRKKFAAFIESQGIKKLILCCTHCRHILPDTLEGSDVELVMLPALLKERGKVSEITDTLSFHDACYDRYTGDVGETARELFPNATLAPLKYEKRRTHCCGGGGMVSCYAVDFCAYRRNQRLAEIDEVESDRLLSTCFSCVNSLQRGTAAKPVQHYLEPIFDYTTDWNQVYASVDALYADPECSELYADEEAKTFDE